MSSCVNCGAAISCGCQLKRASDGAQACTACIAAYEQKLLGGQRPKKDDQVLTIEQKLALERKSRS